MNLADDVRAFLRVLHGLAEFERVAVTEAQIREYNLPTAPAKITDRRSFSGVDGDPTATVQAEALPPDILADIVRSAVTADLDTAVYENVLASETEKRERLIKSISAMRVE